MKAGGVSRDVFSPFINTCGDCMGISRTVEKDLFKRGSFDVVELSCNVEESLENRERTSSTELSKLQLYRGVAKKISTNKIHIVLFIMPSLNHFP
jgi:hypothetical protein